MTQNIVINDICATYVTYPLLINSWRCNNLWMFWTIITSQITRLWSCGLYTEIFLICLQNFGVCWNNSLELGTQFGYFVESVEWILTKIILKIVGGFRSYENGLSVEFFIFFYFLLFFIIFYYFLLFLLFYYFYFIIFIIFIFILLL